jgi:N utilization substance protein B
MLNRRLVRIKVFQGLFANFNQENVNVPSIKNIVNKSIKNMENNMFAMLAFSVELAHYIDLNYDPRKIKFTTTDEDLKVHQLVAENKVINLIAENEKIKKYCDKPTLDWRQETDFLFLVYKKIQKEEVFQQLISGEITNETELEYVRFLYDFLFKISIDLELLMEEKSIVWYDEKIPILKSIGKVLDYYAESGEISLPPLSKDLTEVVTFAESFVDYFFQNKTTLVEDLKSFTPNWDEERLTKIDKILLLMAMEEFLYFPFIPVKVTLNEYIELAKMYSTPNSSKFINGTLDKILKVWQSEGKIIKKGRGLID